MLLLIFKKLLYGIPMLVGVTLISFYLMVYCGPDKTWDLVGKNPTPELIAEVRHQLGYDRPFAVRYLDYLQQTLTFDFGNSDSTGEKVSSIFKRTVPISMALSLPGFLIGELLAIVLALAAAVYRGRWPDRLLMGFSVVGMSISYLIVIMLFQYIFCSSYGLDMFPVTGFEMGSLSDYFRYVTVPTLCIVFVTLGYNTRFFRAIFVEELTKDYIRTARAFGAGTGAVVWQGVLPNCLIPIVTRTVFSIPYLLIGGNLLLESYFSIPGVGLQTYEAITTGNLPVLKAVVGVTAMLYVVCLTLTEIFYRLCDPRVR